MSISTKVFLTAGLVMSGIGLSGCSSSDSAAVDTSVKITQANGAEVASAALTTVRLVGQFSQRLGSIVELLSQPADNASFLQVRTIVPPVPFPCRGSGTQTISGDVADPTFSSLAVGDTLSAVYNACDDADGITLAGTLNLTVTGFTGNFITPPYSLTLETTSSDLSAAQEGETTTISGSATYTISTDNGINVTNLVEIATLDYSEQVSGDSGTLTGFEATNTFDSNLRSFAQDSRGTISSQDIGGSVDFMSTTIFAGFFAGTETNNPESGVMEVTGALSSKEIITALDDSLNVKIEVDENGDGSFGDPILITWAELFTL